MHGKPFAVGGHPDSRGVVASCSYAARLCGVHSAMPMAQAVRLCPDLLIVPPQLAAYQATSQQVMLRLHALTPLVEQISIDEAFLDVTALGEPGDVLAAQPRPRSGAICRCRAHWAWRQTSSWPRSPWMWARAWCGCLRDAAGNLCRAAPFQIWPSLERCGVGRNARRSGKGWPATLRYGHARTDQGDCRSVGVGVRPRVGRIIAPRRGLSLAVGHGSNGFSLAPVTAQAIVAQLGTGQLPVVAATCEPG